MGTKIRTFLLSFSIVAVTCFTSHAAVEFVYPNASPGDDFSNPGGSNVGNPVGTSGWYYNNVRNNGHVGINTNYARSGNGSVWFQGTQGPAIDSSKADIEFLPGAVNVGGNYIPTASLGTLADLNSFSYDWYRDASSTAAAHYHPSLRLFVWDPSSGATGHLVFEHIYNGGGPSVPTDQWMSVDIVGGDYNLWSTGSLPGAFSDYNTTLSEWQASHGNYQVMGISSGIGSGWGPFVGAVDNITIGFAGGTETTFNFEVETTGVVPEPATLFVWSGIALCAGLAYVRKKARF